jgi:hypothetical protein
VTEQSIRCDEAEKCCRDVCELCESGDKPIRTQVGMWRHRDASTHGGALLIRCGASLIRERRYQQAKAEVVKDCETCGGAIRTDEEVSAGFDCLSCDHRGNWQPIEKEKA